MNRKSLPVLDIVDLKVEYCNPDSDITIVNGINFHIEPNEIFGLAGESGCGKSTVAHAIMQLLKPPGLVSEGKILFEGKNILKFDPVQLSNYRWNSVSMVFQSAMNALNPILTIESQFLDLMYRHRKFSRAEADDKIDYLFQIVDINPKRKKDYPHQFSGGMKQRLIIAMALALNPKLIIMDEPTTALDVVVQLEILQKIYELKEKFQFSILFITHDLSLMVEFTDRIGIMYAGELLEVSKSKELLQSPAHPYTEGLASSFPRLTGDKPKLKGIRGDPLDISNRPKGCLFQERCDYAETSCGEEKLFLEKFGNSQYTSCKRMRNQEINLLGQK